MKLYECREHGQRFNEGAIADCGTCIRILERMRQNEDISSRTPKTMRPIDRGPEVYWPSCKNGGNAGRVIEHLDTVPVRVSTKRQYQDELKKRGLVEKG